MAARFWLFSQAGAFVLVGIAVVGGAVLLLGDTYVTNDLVVSINTMFFGPGLMLSLAVNQAVLLKRRPLGTTTADRVVLSLEYLVILCLFICNVSGEPGILSGGFSVLSVVTAVAALIEIGVGNRATSPAR
jgi:hypothetical protein